MRCPDYGLQLELHKLPVLMRSWYKSSYASQATNHLVFYSAVILDYNMSTSQEHIISNEIWRLRVDALAGHSQRPTPSPRHSPMSCLLNSKVPWSRPGLAMAALQRLPQRQRPRPHELHHSDSVELPLPLLYSTGTFF